MDQVRVEIKLKKDWRKSHMEKAEGLVDAFVRLMREYDKLLTIQHKDPMHCVLLTFCEEDCSVEVERMVEEILENDLQIREEDAALDWYVWETSPEEEKSEELFDFIVTVDFDEHWILSKRNEPTLPTEAFIQHFYAGDEQVKLTRQGLAFCKFHILGYSEEAIAQYASAVLRELDVPKDSFSIKIKSCPPVPPEVAAPAEQARGKSAGAIDCHGGYLLADWCTGGEEACAGALCRGTSA
ncbi:MAG: hypothetical protein PHZ05_02625 [Pygmaiobacter massiliensis]|nr:hypothetical protein [Pygmaiobacter massiliensis]